MCIRDSVYPLSYFFSRSLGGGVVGGPGDASSPDTAKAMLKKLITEEDKHKPPVSYTHLDVYKRQSPHRGQRGLLKNVKIIIHRQSRWMIIFTFLSSRAPGGGGVPCTQYFGIHRVLSRDYG